MRLKLSVLQWSSVRTACTHRTSTGRFSRFPRLGNHRRAEDESKLTKEQLEELNDLPKVNLVATRGKNDPKELWNLFGTKEYTSMLDAQFKND